MTDMVYLLFRNKFNDKPVAAFVNKVDAYIFCEAFNAVYEESPDDNDMYMAYVTEMPLVGGWR